MGIHMKNAFFALSLLALVACESDPYPKDGSISTKPERNPYAVRPSLGIDAPDIMRFEEGKDGEYRVAVKVPAGSPVIVWEGLPTGVTYDVTKSALTWKPDYTAANDASNPTVKTREYPVTLILASDADRVTSIRKSILLQVHDTPRPVVISGMRADYSIKEGESLELARFDVASEDFSAGDIRMQLKNSAQGLSLSRGDRSGEWVLKAQYGYEKVKVGSGCSSSWNCELKIEDSLIAIAPDGRQVESDFKIAVKDERQVVSLSLSKSIDVKGDMSVSFLATDLNQEIAPLVKVVTAPAVGLFEIKKLAQKDALAPGSEANYELSWTQLPPEAIGQTYTARIEACNSSYSWSVNTSSCRSHEITLKVLPREVAMPTIARGDWTQSVMKYLLIEKPYNFRIDVSAGRRELSILSLTATSSDSADEVSFANGNLKIKGVNPGIKTLTINVVNSVGGMASGVFLYEVLPAQWAENLVIASASPVAELAPIETLLGKSMRAYFAGQNLDNRSLSFRKSVTVGTHSMSLPDAGVDLAFFAKNLKKVLISTPLLSKLPADIINELRSHGVYLAGRASSIQGFKLSDFELVPARFLGMPTEATGLLGSITSESQDPAMLSLSISSDCERLYSLFKPGAPPQELLVGVSCPRKEGGRLIVLGFEWADLKISQADQALPAQWFKKMMEP